MSKYLHLFLIAANVYIAYALIKHEVPFSYILLIIAANLLALLASRSLTVPPYFSKNEDKLMKQIYEQQDIINKLTAEREITLLVNSEQDYHKILQKSFEILFDLLLDYNVKSLSLLKRDGNKLELLETKGESIPANIEEHFSQISDQTRLTEIADPGSHTLILPLSYNKNIIGYLVVIADAGEKRLRYKAKAERLKYLITELSKVLSLVLKAENLYVESIEDPLTGLASKRYFYDQLNSFFSLSKRHKDNLSLILIDIDDFKTINDNFGHLAGDIVLKGVAKIVKNGVKRKGDIAYNSYRYGGEELAILLPKTPVQGSEKVAERIRKAIEKSEFSISDKIKLHCTCSFGVADIDEISQQPDELFKKADDALYQAKKTGKNKVITVTASKEQKVFANK